MDPNIYGLYCQTLQVDILLLSQGISLVTNILNIIEFDEDENTVIPTLSRMYCQLMTYIIVLLIRMRKPNFYVMMEMGRDIPLVARDVYY